MRHKSFSLQDFQRRFADERACREHLFRLRWPNGFECPRCSHDRHSFHSSRRLYQCAKCKYQVSVTAGTIFHKTRTPLVKWFWTIFLMTRQKSGVSMLAMQRMLGIKTYKTIWTMGHKIRKAMADKDAGYQLGGLMELGGGFVGSHRPDRKKDKSCAPNRVFVAIEDRGSRPGSIWMKSLADGDLANLVECATPKIQGIGEAMFRSALESRKKRRSDSLHGHERPNKWVQVLVSNIRGNIKGVHHGVSEKHLDRYLGEFVYRFNRRYYDSQLFSRAVAACVSTSTITFEELKL